MIPLVWHHFCVFGCSRLIEFIVPRRHKQAQTDGYFYNVRNATHQISSLLWFCPPQITVMYIYIFFGGGRWDDKIFGISCPSRWPFGINFHEIAFNRHTDNSIRKSRTEAKRVGKKSNTKSNAWQNIMENGSIVRIPK